MEIKLYYFNGRGICEPIRWILSYGGIDFEDIRAPVNDQPLMLQTLPKEIKMKCRWQQAPLVEFKDGKCLTQSLAISRYFARKLNLIPDSSYEEALCDEYVDAIRDYWNGISNDKYFSLFIAMMILLRANSPPRVMFWTGFFDALVGKSLEEYIKASKGRFLDVFESIVKNNDGEHLVGNRISWADIWVAFAFQHLEQITGINLIKDYPSLQKMFTMVVSTPRIKEWIERRPTTKF